MVNEAALSQAKTAGVDYHHKKLGSLPPNWFQIAKLIEHPRLLGVFAKITTHDVHNMFDPSYREAADRLFRAVGQAPHLVLAHEQILTGARSATFAPPGWEEEEYAEFWEHAYSGFRAPDEEARLHALELWERTGVKVTPYRTNAELNVLSSSFVEDHAQNLLFRIYVADGRLYASEADKLIGLFRDWLIRAKKLPVRQDGYATGKGRVYELFSETDSGGESLAVQVRDFTDFLDSCANDPQEAAQTLVALGMDEPAAQELVGRYGKESRRIFLDMKHSREAKLLAIRQRLESELVDVVPQGALEWQEIGQSIESMVPAVPGFRAALNPGSASPPTLNVTYNQQIINAVESTVVQNVQGIANLGPDARDLLALIHEYGGAEAQELETAFHELEDEQARDSDRLSAKQRIKGFLFRVAAKVEDTALEAAIKYVEGKIGL